MLAHLVPATLFDLLADAGEIIGTFCGGELRAWHEAQASGVS